MEKHLSNEIIQPSDLYNHEILSESKFESDYGKLLLSNIFVPDFSNDEKGAIRLNEEFNYIKLFISEKNLSNKWDIAKQLYRNEFITPVSGSRSGAPNRAVRSSKTFSDFIDIIYASVQAKLFEMGLYSDVDICSHFGYDLRAPLSNGIIIYNDNPVVQPLSCGAGLYIYCLRCILNPKNYCVYNEIFNEILNKGLPNHNYLSWAIYNAHNNKEIFSFLSYCNPALCFCEN